MNELASRSLIRLRSANSGKYLRVMRDGEVNCTGGKGPDGVFVVHRLDANHLKLSSAESPRYWLRVDAGGELRSDGNGSASSQFVVKHDSRFNISLSPVDNVDGHLGATDRGALLNTGAARSTAEGRFVVERVTSWPTNF